MNKSLNIWFQGGGFACIWSFGVAEQIKRMGMQINAAGGYSAGAGVAIYLLNPNDVHDCTVDICLNNLFSPYRSNFGMMGNTHILMKHLFESVMGYHLDCDLNAYNKRLWIPIRGLKTFKGTWRNSWRDYDDLLETGISTTCIPGMHGELSHCYYEDYNSERGPTIDGGTFSISPPQHWEKNNTVIVSPWGSGDLNMHPKASISDIAFPKKVNLKNHFNLGMEQAREYFDKANI